MSVSGSQVDEFPTRSSHQGARTYPLNRDMLAWTNEDTMNKDQPCLAELAPGPAGTAGRAARTSDTAECCGS